MQNTEFAIFLYVLYRLSLEKVYSIFQLNWIERLLFEFSFIFLNFLTNFILFLPIDNVFDFDDSSFPNLLIFEFNKVIGVPLVIRANFFVL